LKEVTRNIRDFCWVAVPKVSGGVLQLGFNLLLLHYLGPEEYGLLAVMLTAVLLGEGVAGSAVDVGVLRSAPLLEESDPVRSLQIQQSGLILKAVTILILALPVLVFPGMVGRILFGREDLFGYFLPAILLLAGLLFLRSVQTHFQVTRRFRLYGLLDLLQTGLRYGGIGLILALGAASPGRILATHALFPILVASGALFLPARILLQRFPVRPGVSSLFRLVKWYWVTIALGSLISRMDLLFVSALGGALEAGLFSAAKALALAPQLIGMYISVVAGPKIMPMWVNHSFAPTFWKFQSGLIISALSLFLLALITRQYWIWVLPENFATASSITLLLLPAALCALVDFPLTVPFLLFARPRILFFFDLVFFPFLCAGYFWVIPLQGALGAAAVTAAYAVVKTTFFQILAWKIVQRGPAEIEIRDILSPGIAGSARPGMALRSLS